MLEGSYGESKFWTRRELSEERREKVMQNLVLSKEDLTKLSNSRNLCLKIIRFACVGVFTYRRVTFKKL